MADSNQGNEHEFDISCETNIVFYAIGISNASNGIHWGVEMNLVSFKR